MFFRASSVLTPVPLGTYDTEAQCEAARDMAVQQKMAIVYSELLKIRVVHPTYSLANVFAICLPVPK